jgi:4-hydroxy-3-methylbut-2-en-1-yl diphosphate reductase
MRVILARELGFCSGVRRAVSGAEEALQGTGPVAATDTLLHNVHEAARLSSLGLRAADLLTDQELATATVLLPAHGSTRSERRGRISSASAVKDLTCPIVDRARDATRRLAEEGLPIVIVGDREHRETRYLTEAAGARLVEVISSPQDLIWRSDLAPRVGIVYQTTQSREFRQVVLNWMAGHGIEVVEEITLCPEVLRRQDAALALARACSVMLVLGDDSSANTRRLAGVTIAECARTYLVADAVVLPTLGLECSDTVGIVSGTSCPQSAIDEVLQRLRQMCPDVRLEVGT